MDTSTHVILPGSFRPLGSGARRVRDLAPGAHVDLTVTIRAPELPSVDAVPVTLKPDEFARQYGAKSEDVQRVADVLRGFGLSIDSITQGGRSIHVSGSVSAIEAAFHPHLGVYSSPTQAEFRGREGAIEIPRDLDGIVTGVYGLDQRRVAHRKAVAATQAAGPRLQPQAPADLEARYKFPSGAAAGQTIAIAEFGEPMTNGQFLPPVYLPGDVDAFLQKHALPKANVQIVPVNLTPLTVAQLQQLPPALQNAAAEEAVEVMMDVEIVAALCPQATVKVLFATFDQKGWVDLLDALTSSAASVPVALSVSWGSAEDSGDWSAAALAAINQRLQIAAMHGITVCVSSGDDGSGDGVSGKSAHVDFPAASPFVLAVGGTQLNPAGVSPDEVAWWESPGRRTKKGGGASGGGVSTKFARPKWQDVSVKSVNHAAIDGRVVPDVAALAGEPLYDLVFAGRSSPNGGTSASAPLWASLIARVNANLPAAKQQRFLTPLLYAKDASGKALGQLVCRDITLGTNASHPSPGVGYEAGTGYDAVTGWGVPDGGELLLRL
jgi:kumamolisin